MREASLRAAPAHSEAEDEALLIAIQDADAQAFAVLLGRHAPKFFGLAYRLLRRREAAEDMVQEAFLRLWRNPFSWKAEKGVKFTTWFYRVVTNLCLDQQRKGSHAPLEEAGEVVDPALGAEKALMQRQEEARLRAAVRELPERQQAALQLVYYDGLPQAEAAEAMGMQLKGFQSLLQRARGALAVKLKS